MPVNCVCVPSLARQLTALDTHVNLIDIAACVLTLGTQAIHELARLERREGRVRARVS